MAAAVGAAWLYLQGATADRWTDLLAIFALIPAGCLIYGGAIWLLKIEGMDEVLGRFARSR